jgi:FkbM family methyltransferase
LAPISVGANIGLTVAIAGNPFPDSRIVAVEPTKRAFHCLEKTIEANGLKNVTAINACCGDVR